MPDRTSLHKLIDMKTSDSFLEKAFLPKKRLSFEELDRIFFSGRSSVRKFFFSSLAKKKATCIIDNFLENGSSPQKAAYLYKLEGRLKSDNSVFVELCHKFTYRGRKVLSSQYFLKFSVDLGSQAAIEMREPLSGPRNILALYGPLKTWHNAYGQHKPAALKEFERGLLHALLEARK